MTERNAGKAGGESGSFSFKRLAEMGMVQEGVHGTTTEFGGRQVQPVVVWENVNRPNETARTYFRPVQNQTQR